jgi:hypothetical protein
MGMRVRLKANEFENFEKLQDERIRILSPNSHNNSHDLINIIFTKLGQHYCKADLILADIELPSVSSSVIVAIRELLLCGSEISQKM